MATTKGPYDVESTCSVCLEPYKSRDPKLLPCCHTFCLPCLQDIERHHMASSDKKVGEDDEGDPGPLTFPCPTCRALITVPPGGVSQFKANFYLNEESMTCDLCDRDQVARYSCTECHDKTTCNHQVQPLTSNYRESCQSSFVTDYERQLDEQLALLEEALVAMREEEDSLNRERQAVADVISRRADAVRALVTQAEERSQMVLAEVAEKLGNQIQEKIIAARDKYWRIWQLSSHGTTKGKLSYVLRHEKTALLSDDDFEIYRQQCSRGRQIKTLLHQFDDCAIDMQAVEVYIGTVLIDTQSEVKNSNSLVSTSACNETRALEGQECDTLLTSLPSDKIKMTRDIGDIKDKLTALETITSNLEKQQRAILELEILKGENSNLPLDVASLREANSKMKQNINTFQQNVEKSKEDFSNLQKDITNMQHEFREMRTTNFKLQDDVQILYQESSLIKTETKKFQDANEELSKGFKSFREKSSGLVAFNVRLHEDSPASGLILTKADCNVGEAYDDTTGIFTAPATGIYFFMARAMAVGVSQCFYVVITVDRVPAAQSGSGYGSSNTGKTCTVHLLQRLTKGQTVELSVWCDTQLRRAVTSFSGMLVNPEFDIG